MKDIELRATKKDYFRLIIKGVDIFGEKERSFFRHFLQTLDNGIDC